MRVGGMAGAVAGLMLFAIVAPARGGEVAPYPQLFPGPAHSAAATPAPETPTPAPGAGKAAGASAYPATPDSGGFRLGVTAAAVGVVGLMGLAIVAITTESSRAVSNASTGTAASSTPGT